MVTVTYYNTDTRGDTGTYNSVWIAIYKTDRVDKLYVDNAFTFVKNCLDNAVDGGYISGYTVSKRAVGWHPDCGSTNPNLIEQWQNVREDAALFHDGSHVLINDCDAHHDPVALGTTDGNDAWLTDASAHTTTRSDGLRDKGQVYASCFHEPLHALTRRNCEEVQPLMGKDSDGTWNEHSLGVSKNKSGTLANTPFVGGDPSAKKGNCSNEDGAGSNETFDLSTCEMLALQESADHSAGLHDCSGCS